MLFAKKTRDTILCLLFSVPIVCFSQSYFNSAYPQGLRTYQVEQGSNAFFTVVQNYDPQIGKYIVRLLKMDLTGQYIKGKDFLESNLNVFPSNHISLEKTLDSNFITVYSSSKNPFENGLLKFDANLNIKWSRLPKNDSLNRLFYQVKPTPDGGYIVTGYLYRNNMYETMLLKTDSAANPEWERFYQGANGQSLQPFFVYNAPSGGYLVTGLEKDLADATTNDPFLLRTDSLGNVLWKRVLGSPGFDGLPATAYFNMGKRLIAIYSQEADTIPDPTTGYRSFTQVAVKLDAQNGAVLAQDTMDIVFPRMYTYNMTFKNNLGVAVGEFLNVDTLKPGGASFGFTLAVDTLLKEQWFRTYSHRKATAQFDDGNSLFDIRPTSDGGFICAGHHRKDDTLGTGRSGFHAWLLKLDSTGCEVPLCANQIGVDEEIPLPKVGEVQIYPNPADRQINVSIGGLSAGIIRLHDVRGVLLKQTYMQNGQGILDVTNVPEGLYLLQISNDEDYSETRKVLIARHH